MALAGAANWAIVAVWVFNVWGAGDLLFAFYQGARVRLQPGSLGDGYYIVTAVVPLLLASHALIFGLLFAPRCHSGALLTTPEVARDCTGGTPSLNSRESVEGIEECGEEQATSKLLLMSAP